MLNLIFQGYLEWLYSLLTDIWTYFFSALLEAMSRDFNFLQDYIPILGDVMGAVQAAGWALLLGNLVFQALKSMASGLGFEGDDPRLLFSRTFVFAFLLMASPQICQLGLSLTSQIVMLLDVPNSMEPSFIDQSTFGTLEAAWLITIVCGVIVMFKVLRLIVEIAEQYVVLAALTITAPLAFAMGGSRNTAPIFSGWCRMYGSMCLLMVTDIGAPGSGKSRGFIIPFLMGCARRGESVFVTDPKGELFEKLSPYFKEHGHYVKAVNFLDMAHSDGWNCLYGLDTETQLVQTVANTIIQNTSGAREADDFWSRAELNLLMALIHYVVNLKDANGDLLPIEKRGLGDVYQMIAHKSIQEINRTLAQLPPDHPAKGHHGLFLKAKENLWGSIAIGLGNRLAIFQNKLVDAITRNHDVDLLLPGQKPCAYFVIISAQDSAYRFLSSLFFSLALPRLSDYARLKGENGRLPVLVNFCLDEYCNIGYMEGIADALNSIRGFNMSCQVVVQSLSQWQEKYPGKEWENQLATFDQTLYMGCNDLTSAEYISKKCGKVTISQTSSQRPQTPLFSPVCANARYSQTRSSTQRELMQPDEILRLDRRQCIALFQGRKPALLYKLVPEELPGYDRLESCRVADYIPEWRLKEEQAEQKGAPAQTEAAPGPAPAASQPAPTDEPDPSKDLEYELAGADSSLGMVELDPAGVVGAEDEDEESPPG